MSTRWSREDWAIHALEQLARKGVDGVTLDALCRSAGRTRGSLYHHFSDYHALLEATLEVWRDRYTEELIEEIRRAGLAGDTGASRLTDLSTALDFDVEIGVRRLASSRPALRETVAVVDRRRIDFLIELQLEAGSTEEDAHALAEIEYAAYVGMQHLSGLFTAGRLTELYAHFERLTRDRS